MRIDLPSILPADETEIRAWKNLADYLKGITPPANIDAHARTIEDCRVIPWDAMALSACMRNPESIAQIEEYRDIIKSSILALDSEIAKIEEALKELKIMMDNIAHALAHLRSIIENCGPDCTIEGELNIGKIKAKIEQYRRLARYDKQADYFASQIRDMLDELDAILFLHSTESPAPY